MQTRTTVNNKKTTIILGAGFSYRAGLPMQNNLLTNVDKYYSSNGTAEERAIWNKFRLFFVQNIGFDLSVSKIEDIFTILDKTLIDNESFRGASTDDVRIASRNLLSSIKNYIADVSSNNFHNRTTGYQDYSTFAKMIVESRMINPDDNNLSIICLNWDDYLERMITYIQRTNTEWNDTLIDYCTYEHTFSNSGKAIPSIIKKAKGKINLKLLKPHGSVNWGYCPNCGRLYISLGSRIRTKYECIKFCNKRYKRVALHPILLTPTFLKDLSNSHIKGIWQNVGIELDEATSVIFIGYSLRPEDFYFRYHLLKYINKETKIYVFDHTSETAPIKIQKYHDRIYSLYDNFFQTIEGITVYVDGWEKNIETIRKIIEG